MDREDYYEYHESREALAEGQLPNTDELFECCLSGAALNSVCIYFRSTRRKHSLGWMYDTDCTFPLGGYLKCPFKKFEKEA